MKKSELKAIINEVLNEGDTSQASMKIDVLISHTDRVIHHINELEKVWTDAFISSFKNIQMPVSKNSISKINTDDALKNIKSHLIRDKEDIINIKEHLLNIKDHV